MPPAYLPEIAAAAAAAGLEAGLVQAVVEQESDYDTTAYRYEPAFWTRYLSGLRKYSGDDPRVVSASYGLMQCMYPAAVDAGFTGAPTDLYTPAIGLEWGCKILAGDLAWARRVYTGMQTKADAVIRRAALAAYNGGRGGNSPNMSLRSGDYADQVLARYQRIKASTT